MNTSHAFRAGIFLLVGMASAACAGPVPDPGTASEQTYEAALVYKPRISLDGKLHEAAWTHAAVDDRFVFPWKQTAAPPTTFRAFHDGASLYFGFVVNDPDLVVLEKLKDERDAVFEDRVEIYLSRDDAMRDYFCFEVDSRGRIFDYRASFHRKFDTKWDLKGIKARGATTKDGYVVEGVIPLKSLEAAGFPPMKTGSKVRWGLYRAEFSHDRSGKQVEQKETLHNLGRTVQGAPPIEEWISWVDPKTAEPEFHVPASLGWLVFK